jgi:magnesium chelatase family protein
VLFLDEAPHFAPSVLDALREPLESGSVTIARSGFRTTFPAAFQLVLAANPCPCGRGDLRGVGCRCTPMQRRRYASRLSGPLLDRIDLPVTTQSVEQAALLAHGIRGESTAQVRERVLDAAARMQARLAGTAYGANARVPGAVLKGESPLGVDPAALEWLRGAVARGRFSARGIDKVLRVAWSIADLAGAERPGLPEVAEAVGLRDDRFAVAA